MPTKTTKTTKTSAYSLTVADLAVDQKKIKQANDDLRHAREEVSRLEVQLEDAQSRARDTRKAIESGSLSPNGDDLRNADTQVEALELALAGANRRLRELLNTGAVTNTDLLAAVEPGLTAILPGCTTVFSVEAPPEEAPTDIPLPILWVSQTKPHTVAHDGYKRPSRSGAVAGELLVRYYRDESHRPLREEDIVSALSSSDHRKDVPVKVNLRFNGDAHDTYRVDVLYAVPALPRIATKPTEGQRMAASNPIGRIINAACTLADFGAVWDGGTWVRPAPHVDHKKTSGYVTDVKTSDKETVATIVYEGVVVSPNGRIEVLADALEKSVHVIEGYASDKGRYRSATLTTAYEHGGNTVGVKLTIEAVSAA